MSCRLSRYSKHLHYVTPCAGRWATSSCSGCFKCVMQAQPLTLSTQPPALCHTICSARNSRAPLAAGFEEGQAAAAVVQVCHAGSAATPATCTMSHHVQDGGQQEAAAGVLSVSCRLSRCPNHLHYVTPSAGRWATTDSDPNHFRSASFCCSACSCAGWPSVLCRLPPEPHCVTPSAETKTFRFTSCQVQLLHPP